MDPHLTLSEMIYPIGQNDLVLSLRNGRAEQHQRRHALKDLPGNGFQTWFRSGILETLFEEMRRGLGLLSLRERMILERFYGLGNFEETSVRDIANLLDLSETTVKHIKADVLKRMRSYLCSVIQKAA